MSHVFVTGGTGYLGRPLLARLAAAGHTVRALVRPGSEHKLPAGVGAVTGDALDVRSFASRVAPADTIVHLVGTPRPSPAKAREFTAVDLRSIEATTRAAVAAGVGHVVYVGVAHPAPVMRAYVDVRVRGEAMLREAGLDATVLRPWYVLGPGHYWPYVLVPLYALLERLPSTRDTARRLGLVTHRRMVDALVHAVEHPPRGTRIVSAEAIRRGGVGA